MPSDEENENVLTKKHKSRPSWYDRFFQQVNDPTMRKHRCVECGWLGMALPNSLQNLKRHFESVTKYKTCKDRYLTWKKERELLQPTIDAVIRGETNKMSSESQVKIDKLLAEFIIASEVPLRLVELTEFRNLLNALNSKYNVPYRPKLKKSLLTPMLKDSNDELSAQLDKCQYVALTIDGWSSRRQLSMLSLVVNFIDRNGILRSELLTLTFFKGKHTGERIAQFTQHTASEWDLENKIVRVGSDNAANMKKAFDTVLEIEHELVEIDIDGDEDELEEIEEKILTDAWISIFEYLSDMNLNSLTSKLRAAGLLSVWGRCICHLIQLCVNDFIQKHLRAHGSVNKFIVKANQFVNSARKSVQCGEIFLEYKFTLDAMNQTRWNSMHKMLQSLLDAETKGFLKLLPPLKHPIPRNYELSILREVVDVLEPIHLFTLEFESSLGTSGMVITGLEALYHHFNSIDSEQDSMSQIMSRLIQDRFSVIVLDHFMIIANCVDPRFATKALVKQSLLEILKKVMKIVIHHERDLYPPPTSVKLNLPLKRKSLFDNLPRSEAARVSDVDIEVIENEIFIFKSECRLVNQIIETDPINWWRRHQNRMPHLSRIAAIYLLPTPSIAENERVFSIAGRICRPHRATLDVSTLVMLVTLKHRLQRQKRAKPDTSTTIQGDF